MSTSVCRVVPPSPVRPGAPPSSLQAPLPCPYASPSPRTPTNRPSCCHPRSAVRCRLGGGVVAASGLDPAANIGGSSACGGSACGGSSGCAAFACAAFACASSACGGPGSGRLGRGGLATSRLAAGRGASRGASRVSVSTPGDLPAPASGSAEAGDPDRAGGFARGSRQTPPPCRAGGPGSSVGCSCGSWDSRGVGALVSQASVDRRRITRPARRTGLPNRTCRVRFAGSHRVAHSRRCPAGPCCWAGAPSRCHSPASGLPGS